MLKFHSDWIYSGQITKGNDLILDHTFFGITQEYKLKLHDEFFNFLYQGEGGFDHDTMYTLPITIRDRYFSNLSKILEKKAEHYEKMKSKNRSYR